MSKDITKHKHHERFCQLAKTLTQALMYPSLLDTIYESGLFIGGDSGSGKTTFLQVYLIPQLKNGQAIVIYRSLSAGLDQGTSVTSIIHDALGVEHGTIAEHLTQWIHTSSHDVILILDDIQLSQCSQDGKISLFSLKTARDAVNLNPEIAHRFFLIGVGSPLSQIRNLVWRRDAAFYGAALMEL